MCCLPKDRYKKYGRKHSFYRGTLHCDCTSLLATLTSLTSSRLIDSISYHMILQQHIYCEAYKNADIK